MLEQGKWNGEGRVFWFGVSEEGTAWLISLNPVEVHGEDSQAGGGW